MRQPLVGAAIAPGNSRTQKLLQDETPQTPRGEEPDRSFLLEVEPEEPFNFDVDHCTKRCSGRSFRDDRFLADTTCTRLFGEVAGQFARGAMLEEVLQGVKVGRMTALTKPDGGVRGIVVGDVFRRLAARTIAQPTHPFQCTSTRKNECGARRAGSVRVGSPVHHFVSGRSGCVRQHLPGSNLPGRGGHATWRKVDPVHPFVLLPSRYLSENEVGDLGQHRALVAANAELREGERLMAFLDDVYVNT